MFDRLRAIHGLHLTERASLSPLTRFALGGPAAALADVRTEAALAAAIRVLEPTPWTLIGGGSNLVVSDQGFPGVVLRYTEDSLRISGNRVVVGAGAVLQDLVDQTTAAGLEGLETMTGIPGWVGGAVYGNAGAYGHSLHERIESVRFFDGATIREIPNAACQFRYRESVFKREKQWVIVGATLQLTPGDRSALKAKADSILRIRNEKYPPTMHCAGSIFKNLLLCELAETVRQRVPENVIREGKVPSAFFLEQVGAKGMTLGGIKVADYHANLLYNQGSGSAAATRQLIEILKDRVRESYGLTLEEEVQYVGMFDDVAKKSGGSSQQLGPSGG